MLSNIDGGEIAAIVTGIGLVLTYFGVTGIDSSIITGAVEGVVGIVTFISAFYSWYSHHQKNAAA